MVYGPGSLIIPLPRTSSLPLSICAIRRLPIPLFAEMKSELNKFDD